MKALLRFGFVQNNLPTVDLNNSETTMELFKLAQTIGEGALENHEKNSAKYMDKMAELCKAHGKNFDEVLKACLEREEKKVAELLDELAFYKAVALFIQCELDGYKDFVKERGLKPPPKKENVKKGPNFRLVK